MGIRSWFRRRKNKGPLIVISHLSTGGGMIQIEGTIDSNPFYFRDREGWSISITPPGIDPHGLDMMPQHPYWWLGEDEHSLPANTVSEAESIIAEAAAEFMRDGFFDAWEPEEIEAQTIKLLDAQAPRDPWRTALV